MTDRTEGAGERRWRIEGGLVAAAFVVGMFFWAVIDLINKLG